MALNKYMHPRNLYKTPPDFAKLAKSFVEFSSIAKTDVTGKVNIDFKNPHCLRVLTKCLLKSDFGLDVIIPEDRLVPTLPLRLNYILWVEDLLNAIDKTDNIRGLDIGTGACAIYPILAAVKNKWQMVGTESDQGSLQKAQENVERNKLQDLIQLSKNPSATLLEYLFSEEDSKTFDFCMCNPPFYSNVQELCESRSPARLPPKNGFTGSLQELITEGGELTFCRKMITESKVYKDKVLIFSTMVGHKFNLKELVLDLKAEGIKYTTTEFCQGRVTRWGLAWTYQDYDLDILVPGRDKPRKKNIPIVYLLPKGQLHSFNTVSEKLLEIINKLKMKYKILNKKGNQLALDVQATENTWSNQRRKRRMTKLQQDDAKKPKLNQSSDTIDAGSSSDANEINTANQQPGPEQDSSKRNWTDNYPTLVIKHKESNRNAEKIRENENKFDGNKATKSNQEPEVYNINTSRNSDISEYLGCNVSGTTEPLVHSFFKLLKKDNDILLEMEFLDGTAGKEGVHQIMQYIKNNWK